MPRRNITITVSGPTNSGKSTIAAVIERALSECGIEVEPDVGAPDVRTAPTLLRYLAAREDGGPIVSIVSVDESRASIPGEGQER